ncbi:hypothetical protein JST97_27615 [bacterium]|nr:hypothetical protein [bacterium]
MDVWLERLEYRVLRGDDCLELRRHGGFAFKLGLGSLILGFGLSLLPVAGSQLGWVLVGCGLLLWLRVMFPERPWVFREGRVTGPGLDCCYSQVGLPTICELEVGRATIYALTLPVSGGSRRILSDTQKEPLEQLSRELQLLLGGQAGEFAPAPGLDRLELRRLLVGGILLAIPLLVSPLAYWCAPEAELEGVKLWVLGLTPLWAGFWESAGRPALPPARGPLVWGNYLFIAALVLCGRSAPQLHQ